MTSGNSAYCSTCGTDVPVSWEPPPHGVKHIGGGPGEARVHLHPATRPGVMLAALDPQRAAVMPMLDESPPDVLETGRDREQRRAANLTAARAVTEGPAG